MDARARDHDDGLLAFACETWLQFQPVMSAKGEADGKIIRVSFVWQIAHHSYPALRIERSMQRISKVKKKWQTLFTAVCPSTWKLDTGN